NDAPTTQRCACRKRQRAGDDHPRWRREGVDSSVRQQQGGDHADRFLRVIGPMAEGQRRRSHPLAGLCAAAPPVSYTPRGSPEDADYAKRDKESQYRRDPERDQGPEDTNGMEPVHPAPVDGMNASLNDCRSDKTADQGMT